MKVLFAVSSESISDAIIKRYQKEYKEILSYKNVYYFNAILKEIQKDKSYDRIVISEDLEPFPNNNYDAIDKFIFEKLDNISDEAHDNQGKETSIILICTDRHTKGSSFLVKLFGIGVYNALLGNDRSMDQVCKLINQPRVKKEAKMYYKVDSDDVNYDPSSEKEVSELEIQNILNHFKKIAKNKDKYADSFNNIASQYTDEQLKIIVNCLPINVKAVLEEECQKYQELMSASMIQRVGGKATIQARKEQEATGIKIDILENKLSQPKMSGPIVIPSSVKTAGSKGPIRVKKVDNAETEKSIEKKVVKKVAHAPVVQAEPIQEDELDFDNLLSDIDEIEDDSVVMPLEDEQLDSTLSTPVENETDDDFSILLNDESEEDDFSTLLDDEQENDDFSISLENESEEDEFSTLLDDEQDDNLSTQLNDELEDDDFSMLLNDESEDELMSFESQPEINDEEMDDFLPNLEDEEVFEEQVPEVSQNKTITIKKGRGRPRKNLVEVEQKPKGKRGRPRKNQIEENQEDEEDASLDLMLDDEFEEETTSSNMFLNEEDDEFSMTLDEQEEENSLLMSLEDEQEDDDFSMLLDDEQEDNDLKMSLNDEQEDDDFSMLLDDEQEDNDLEMSLNDEQEDEEYPIIDNEDDFEIADNEIETEADTDTAEISLPDLDDLDDIEDYEENDDDEILSGMDYEEIDEEDYLLGEPSHAAENNSLDITLDDIEEEPLIPTANSRKEDGRAPIPNNFTNSLNTLEDNEPILNQNNNNYQNKDANKVESIKPQVDYSMSTLNSLLTKDKKIVTFIGTTKNGTSFLINNLAALFSSIGINTAVLDMTQNRNSYYIYTKNEEELRKIAYTSIEKLENGFAEGIKVDKNLTVYTALPNNGKNYQNAEPILSTLVQNHSVVLIDCDFDTDPSYFASCQEIYLVQSMDILTIQPLTSFLRDLKAKGVLESEKVRVVINKELKVRSLTTKMIIGGMSFYNDPAMAFMTELFNKDTVKACSIPFEDATYSRYLDAMVNCNVSLNGCSKAFKDKLRILGEMVYPLTSKQTYAKPTQNYNKNAFSSSMNNTLNQMKNKF